jgi:hypothetical protein
VKGRIESGADDAPVFQRPQVVEARVIVDDGDAFEPVSILRDGVEHAAIVAAVT